MKERLDYSREDAMKILNNESYSDEDKRKLYDQYMSLLKKNRKNAVVNKLNEYARDIPVITKEIYISKLKEYENDDLSKPFEVIEEELRQFEQNMQNKYTEYLNSRKEEIVEEEIKPDAEITPDESFDDTIFNEPIIGEDILLDTPIDDEEEEEVKPSLLITDEISVINEEPDDMEKTLFDKNANEFIPEEDDENEREKGSASAIILSIIAVIIGIIVMYTIIKLN